MGTSDSNNRMWLLPEEALFLLERGSLDIRWSARRSDAGESHDDKEGSSIGELPMSLQAAYACLIGKSGLTLERYTVFAGLRRSGYTVVRAPTWNNADSRLNGHPTIPPAVDPGPMVGRNLKSLPTRPDGVWGLVNSLLLYLYRSNSQSLVCPSLGPLVAPGLYRSYKDIYRALALIPIHHPDKKHETIPTTLEPPFRITYHVWKPSAAYRKTHPPEPDFRIAVVDARDSNVPSMEQMGALLDCMPPDELPRDKRLEQRIKHGKRNVILAVVDTGVVSYLRFSDACFGEYELFEQKTMRQGGGKRGCNRKRGGKRE